MAQDITTPPDTELIRQGASRIRELKIDLMAGYYIPTGSIMMYGGTVAPAAWLLCDGSAVSRTTYAALFTAIGTTWGVGDGVTTFNLPDLRGRVPMGSGTGSGLTPRTLAQTAGEEKHTLVAGEIPAGLTVTDPGHAHTITDPQHSHGITDPQHSHTVPVSSVNSGAGGNVPVGSTHAPTTTETSNPASTGVTVNNAATGVTANSNTTGISVGGGGAGHNVVQPSAVVSFMIKAF